MNNNITNEKRTERPATRIPEILADPMVRQHIEEHYKALDKEQYARSAIFRWQAGTRYPSIDMLASMAKIRGTNISYVLGLTDVDCLCEFKDPPASRTMQDLLDVRGMSDADIANALKGNYRSLNLYKKELPAIRVSSLIKLSRAIGLSADYILGYSDWETWELYQKLQEPFYGIDPGKGVYIVADKSVRTMKDVERAIARGDGQNGIMSSDGKHVIFPNGKKYRTNDPIFIGTYICVTKPEVDQWGRKP